MSDDKRITVTVITAEGREFTATANRTAAGNWDCWLTGPTSTGIAVIDRRKGVKDPWPALESMIEVANASYEHRQSQ